MLGCNGRGVAVLSRLGRLVADLSTDEISAVDCPFPLSPIAPIPLHAFRRIAVEAAAFWYRALANEAATVVFVGCERVCCG